MKQSASATVARMGASLSNRNFRRYLVGMWLSMLGMWMESTAAAWLVFQLTDSPMALGVYSALRLGPILVFGAYGGLLIDRFRRRRLMLVTQSLLLVAALALVVVTLMPTVSIALVFILAFLQGCINSVDNPLKRTFIRDLVTDEELPNAIALNTTAATVARTAGPAVGGVMIALFGVTWNFGINALSYGAVILALLLIDKRQLRPTAVTPRGRAQVRAGLRYALTDDRIWTILLIATVVGTFAWNYGVLMPVYSTVTFGGDATMYGILLATVGAGAFAGALRAAHVGERSQVQLLRSVGLVAASLVGTAVAPNLAVAVVALFALGATGTTVIIASQTNLQLRVVESFSGRILALYSIAFIGTKPIGGLLGGWLMEISGPRLAFIASGALVGLMAIALGIYEARTHRTEIVGSIRKPSLEGQPR